MGESAGFLDERYEIGGRLGAGAMGAVYKATRSCDGLAVAIKFPGIDGLADDDRDSLLRRFRDEASAAARVRHPNLVTVHEAGVDERRGAFIVYEYIDGRDLRRWVRERGAMSWPEIMRLVARPLLSALAALHAAGVVHRDVKPENIMMTSAGVLKLCDFGLATFEGRSSRTRTGIIVGTPGYVAPERFISGKNLSGRSGDVYSAGAVLFRILTGREAFRGKAVADVVRLQLRGSYDMGALDSAAAPEHVKAAIAASLSPDPDGRPATAEDFLASLEAASPNPGNLAAKRTRCSDGKALSSNGRTTLDASGNHSAWAEDRSGVGLAAKPGRQSRSVPRYSVVVGVCGILLCLVAVVLSFRGGSGPDEKIAGPSADVLGMLEPVIRAARTEIDKPSKSDLALLADETPKIAQRLSNMGTSPSRQMAYIEEKLRGAPFFPFVKAVYYRRYRDWKGAERCLRGLLRRLAENRPVCDESLFAEFIVLEALARVLAHDPQVIERLRSDRRKDVEDRWPITGFALDSMVRAGGLGRPGLQRHARRMMFVYAAALDETLQVLGRARALSGGRRPGTDHVRREDTGGGAAAGDGRTVRRKAAGSREMVRLDRALAALLGGMGRLFPGSRRPERHSGSTAGSGSDPVPGLSPDGGTGAISGGSGSAGPFGGGDVWTVFERKLFEKRYRRLLADHPGWAGALAMPPFPAAPPSWESAMGVMEALEECLVTVCKGSLRKFEKVFVRCPGPAFETVFDLSDRLSWRWHTLGKVYQDINFGTTALRRGEKFSKAMEQVLEKQKKRRKPMERDILDYFTGERLCFWNLFGFSLGLDDPLLLALQAMHGGRLLASFKGVSDLTLAGVSIGPGPGIDKDVMARLYVYGFGCVLMNLRHGPVTTAGDLCNNFVCTLSALVIFYRMNELPSALKLEAARDMLTLLQNRVKTAGEAPGLGEGMLLMHFDDLFGDLRAASRHGRRVLDLLEQIARLPADELDTENCARALVFFYSRLLALSDAVDDDDLELRAVQGARRLAAVLHSRKRWVKVLELLARAFSCSRELRRYIEHPRYWCDALPVLEREARIKSDLPGCAESIRRLRSEYDAARGLLYGSGVDRHFRDVFKYEPVDCNRARLEAYRRRLENGRRSGK